MVFRREVFVRERAWLESCLFPPCFTEQMFFVLLRFQHSVVISILTCRRYRRVRYVWVRKRRLRRERVCISDLVVKDESVHSCFHKVQSASLERKYMPSKVSSRFASRGQRGFESRALGRNSFTSTPDCELGVQRRDTTIAVEKEVHFSEVQLLVRDNMAMFCFASRSR